MSKKTYQLRVTAYVVLEVDNDVIEVVDDDWRARFYPLFDREEILGHLVQNVVLMGRPVCRLDGWADQPCGTVLVDDIELDTIEILSEET